MGMASFVETGMASTEDELQLTLMLAVMASEGLNDFITKMSPEDAAKAHGFESHVAGRLQPALDRLGMIERQFDSMGGNPINEVLYLSPKGVELLGKYREVAGQSGSVRSQRFMAAATAVLRWRDADQGMAAVRDITQTPFGYFCGHPFQDRELEEVFVFLQDKGLLKAFGASGEPSLGLQLTPAGTQCVLRYGADVDDYERSSRSSGVNNTYNMGNVKNFVAGNNHGTMNAWTQVQDPNDAAALLAAAIRIASLNGEITGDTAQRLAHECHDELLEAAQETPSPDVRRSIAEKVKDLSLLLAGKSVESATTVLAGEGLKSLLEGLIG
ncbi:hypothetical protein D7003_14930 [Arthrobacter oryzae]|uniref:Uncharacterized protein n=2 Tax=Arthrobacter oryzae TaxID=409290 RepID=A0A3N0BSN9_9MICC|nr:hypothetical protein D7003_14930 [Arthrobacter oryzae]